MHLVVREARDLNETADAVDLALAPADIVFFSFSDSDLTSVATALAQCPPLHRPALHPVSLHQLRHPMSVDLFVEKTLPGTKSVVVRLLGGLDYWRYGGEQLGRACRALGVQLAIVPGDFRPDPRLTALSTASPADLSAIEALLDTGGPANIRAALAGFLARAKGSADPIAPAQPVADFASYRAPAGSHEGKGRAAVVFYRSHYLAGDTAPIEALIEALNAQGLDTAAYYVPSLKEPTSAHWLQSQLQAFGPTVIINATAFAAQDSGNTSPLEAANCPVLQVALAASSREVWQSGKRGLSATDLAMHVVLPELDGRLFAGAISFKELIAGAVRHVPDCDGIDHVAQRAGAWSRLRTTSAKDRKVALVLSTYPGRLDQIAHAVGLDALQSSVAIAARLEAEGYRLEKTLPDAQSLTAALGSQPSAAWSIADYTKHFEQLPEAFRASVTGAWGKPEDDPFAKDGAFGFKHVRAGHLTVCLQPERGEMSDRKAGYHDPATPPRHSYVAFYLWLRHVLNIEALIHLGAHGTLEWLPGKAVALSSECAPQALIGPLPVIYPFIVNDPGEAAQAKRRLGAVTLGHRPPPQAETELSPGLLEVERLVDEFSAADGLDPRRRKALTAKIIDAASRAGLQEACGLSSSMSEAEALARIDAFLCDVKELSIRDGLHVLDETELSALVRALDGQFIEGGPSGAPSRGRSDVLPAGRNLYAVDPRALPTPTASANGERAAAALIDRYVSDHGQWPRAIVLDVWGSATLRTGGEELATALALLGVKPVWDHRSFRVTGVETIPISYLGRPRVDVTLRISGLFRDMFATQLALFDSAVNLVAGLKEDEADNPLVNEQQPCLRIFGPPDGTFGAGVMSAVDRGTWMSRADLGQTYLDASKQAYSADGVTNAEPDAFKARVRQADAFLHIQDHREIDVLTGGDFAAHEGGFAAAAEAAGNARAALYHGDTAKPEAPKMRKLSEEVSLIVQGRATSPRWISGQMRHGYRGAAEMAATVDAAFTFEATARALGNGGFERLYEAYIGDPAVAAFVERENPAAMDAMQARFADAIARGLWQPRRNDVLSHVQASSKPEAAE